ncbi:MAG: CapA family protein [Oscillospiraceae bacterium]|nr:CapA family protein [Oscillospiraceae bacterium]
MSRNNNPHTGLKIVLTVLILCMIAATVFLIKLCLDMADYVPDTTASEAVELPTDTRPTETTEAPTETTMPVPEHVVSTATIGSMGDLLMHEPIFNYTNSAVLQSDGSYDFESIFRYLTEYTSALDYAAVNLETTLCGTDNGYKYSGYPHFNCSDEIVTGAKDAGFDMLLTANNHSYDTSLVGYKRTLEVIREQGLDTLGTYASADETKWFIKEINGINIGMLCYTYATGASNGRPQLNGNAAISESGICNYFLYEDLPAFYNEVETYLAEMEAAGAEATMMYIHWGVEYQLTANDNQKTIAQALCDLGIDVIVGGHPHVVQPVELLTSSTDPDHKTVCLYSMGNAVSNQRLGNISYINTAHTEDGILFTVTFEKYSDGTVYLANADAIPTWVNMHNNSAGKREYNILPLDYDRIENWQEMFEIGENTLNSAKKSYDRTMAIVGEGLAESQEYLAQQKQAREEYYYDLAFFPEKYATEPTETTEAA